MIGQPKHSAAVCGPILIGVVNVNVDNMAGERVRQIAPAAVARARELQNRTEDRIVLIVVMGNDRFGAVIISVLVVGINLAVIAPTIFVNDFAASEQAGRAIND